MQAHLQWLHKQLAITLHVRHDIIHPSLHPPDAAFGLYLTGTPSTFTGKAQLELCTLYTQSTCFGFLS